MPEVGGMSTPQAKRISFDVEQAKIDELSLGDEVEVKIRGKIVKLSAQRVFEFGPKKSDKDVDPPSVEIERSSVSIDKVEDNVFTELDNEAEDGG